MRALLTRANEKLLPSLFIRMTEILYNVVLKKMATTMMPAKDEITVLEHATLKVSEHRAQ